MTASSALAHHNHLYFYDQCKSVTIEGRVDSVQLTDPHATIVIRLDDGSTYTVDWMTLNYLRRNGILSRQRRHWRPEPASRSWAPDPNCSRDTRVSPGFHTRGESTHYRREADSPGG